MKTGRGWGGKDVTHCGKVNSLILECHYLLHNRDVSNNNTDWSACGAINGRIRTLHPEKKKGLRVIGINTQVLEIFPESRTVFTHSPGTIRPWAGIIPHLAYFFAKCSTNFEITCAHCISFWFKIKQFLSLAFLLIKRMAYNNGVANKKVVNRETGSSFP